MGELPTEPYKGVRDFYPADWAQLSAVFDRLRTTLAAWGYEEYAASPLERAELYESKGSEEIIREQSYTFEDRGGRRVTLRPEMTPTLARMVAAKRRLLSLPLRWFSIGNRFRYERPQKGRMREFFQADIDLVGLAEGEADLEILTLAAALLKAFGATEKDFVIRLNSRALLNEACREAGLKSEAARSYLRLLDKKAKIPASEFREAQQALTNNDPLRYLDENAMASTLTALKKRGVGNAVFDPSLTRGFDYYTGLVFEIYDTSPQNPRSLFGGGRYDNLIGLFSGEGGAPIPAVGFAVGDVTLMDFLTARDLLPKARTAPDLYLGTVGAGSQEAAIETGEVLRTRGLKVFINLTEKSLGDQVKDAVKRGIPYFAAIGEEEKHSQTLRVKRLASSEERPMALADVAPYILNA